MNVHGVATNCTRLQHGYPQRTRTFLLPSPPTGATNGHAPDRAQKRAGMINGQGKRHPHASGMAWGAAGTAEIASKKVAIRGKNAPKGGQRQAGSQAAAPFAIKTVASSERHISPVIAVHDTILEVKLPGSVTRFHLKTAQVALLRSGRRPIHWRFAGPQGSITLELTRNGAWTLIENLDEHSVAPGPAGRRGRH
jgi:hypothetical protein